ncbi:MAG: acyl-CoA carboxylase epsilon subunit [Arthrobacter sp.]|uniref:acyl-CoA carboxylase epsilon subunit n=1 Tax=Arthrobacter sp. TaxID=1667 RepID=UPI00347264CF
MDTQTTGAPGPPEAALFSVARGNPTAEELAALTAVLLALGNGTEAAPAEPPRREVLRRNARRGRQLAGLPGAWRSGRS